MKVLLLYTFLMFALPPYLQAQRVPVNFEPLTIEEGLPHTDATCVTQDDNKFLWLGTLDGLCRYDGYELKIYRNNPSDTISIGSNRVLALANDSQREGLWVGTQSGGLNFFDYSSNSVKRFQVTADSKSISSNQVNNILVDSKDRIWVGTNKGLNLLRSFKEETFERIMSTIDLRINIIYEDKDKRLWIGSDKGLFIVDSNSLIPVFDEWVNTIIAHFEPGKILVGTGEGLYSIDITERTSNKLFSENAQAIYLDEDTNIWIGSRKGIYIKNKAGEEIGHYIHKPDSRKGNLTGNKIKHFYKDSFNTLWICTLGGGISQYNAYRNKFKTYPGAGNYELKEKINQPICFEEEDNGKIWIGTKEKGLALFNRLTNSYSFFPLDNATESTINSITALYKDSLGRLWIGTLNGLFLVEKAHLKNTIINNDALKFKDQIPDIKARINKVHEDRNGNIWVATYEGLIIIKPNGSVRHLLADEREGMSSSKNVVTDIFFDYPINQDHLTVWVGTQDGLNRLNFKYPEIEVLSHKIINNGTAPGALPSDFISFIHKDENASLWIGTLGGGLNKMLKGKTDEIKFESITIKNGLRTNDVETVLEDEDENFWIGGHGLLKFNPFTYNFKYYNVEDGLQSNSFKVYAAYKIASGEMIFGGINGFNIFDPLEIKENPIPPQTVFTQLLIANKPVALGQKIDNQIILHRDLNAMTEITIPSKFNDFSIEFAGIHTASPEKEIFRFKLDGYDEKWTTVKSNQRSASYAKLPPGDYSFKVASANGDGVWDPSFAELKIEVLPTFWQSIYGYMLYATLIILIIYFFARYSVIKIGEKAQLTIEKYQIAKEVETYQHKLDFFTNVSHEIRTPLTLIMTPVEQLIEENGNNERTANKLKLVYKNANRLKMLADQLLDFRKLEDKKMELNLVKGNIIEFLNQIYFYYTDYARIRNISFQLHSSVDVIDLYFDREKMEQVFYNIITNAFKFTPKRKAVNITIELAGPHVVIAIANEGSYIPEAAISKIFDPFFQAHDQTDNKGSGLGLALSKYVTELHQGHIYAKSSKNGDERATTFYVELPLHIKYKEEFATQQPDANAISNFVKPKDNSGKIAELSAGSNTNRHTILIIEDNFELRTFLKDELKEEYNIQEADNGYDGLKIARTKELDLVLTDIMLPGMDGITLCREIKTKVTTSHLLVFMLTARDTVPQRLTGLEAMADDYMTKPFNIKILKVRIRNLIENRERLKSMFRNEKFISPKEVTYNSADEIILEKAMAAIEKNMENHDLTVIALCREVGMSRPQLYRKLKALTGLSINAFINTIRLKRAAQLLEKERYFVSEVIDMVGFSSLSYFNRAFKAQFGCNPKDYKEKTKI